MGIIKNSPLFKDVPNAYDDPFWSEQTTMAEHRHNLPYGLLNAIRNSGEHTPNDWISPKGARGVYQIMPETRDGALEKWGIDAYKSPEEHTEVAALLLQDSLNRNHGSVNDALAEYHAGPNRRGWGPITREYIERVSNSKHLSKEIPQSVFEAYQSGTMDEKARAELESDLKNHYVRLPGYLTRQSEILSNLDAVERNLKSRSAKSALDTLDTVAKRATTPEKKTEVISSKKTLPQSVTDAYFSGKMSQAEQTDLENDITNGYVELSLRPAQKRVRELSVADTEAYLTGRYTKEQVADLERTVKQGLVRIPKLKYPVGELPRNDAIPGQYQPLLANPPYKPEEYKPTFGEQAIGAGESALTLATGIPSGLLGDIASMPLGAASYLATGKNNLGEIKETISKPFTYVPRTVMGQKYTQTMAEILDKLEPLLITLGFHHIPSPRTALGPLREIKVFKDIYSDVAASNSFWRSGKTPAQQQTSPPEFEPLPKQAWETKLEELRQAGK
ncbi:LT_GEWL domain containing protein [uncultured Caudovirales phage]|uniref:LT_GEWL domain containing protein n=1 Tax=uncultured Caudovirales phage TaxID=2100421 RepID=A0A6J5L0Y1_9CAUD|nr:LT_GEWL domain containing protein [uncultured Caudovirales phage]